MATLIMSAKLNDIDPQAWFADVLARIADTSKADKRRSCAYDTYLFAPWHVAT
jgi:hypothetical protein